MFVTQQEHEISKDGFYKLVQSWDEETFQKRFKEQKIKNPILAEKMIMARMNVDIETAIELMKTL